MITLTLTTTIILIAVSFGAGFIDSIAGGGGLLLLPALLVAGVPPQLTLGTNKFASSFGTTIAFINFVRNKKVVWRIVAVGLLFCLFGSAIGTKSVLLFSNESIGKIIVILLPLAMLATLVPRKTRTVTGELPNNGIYLKVPFINFFIGFYDGFFGPGTGSFLILAFYLFMGLDLVRASATAKAFNLASNISALLIFLLNGKVLFYLGIPLALANIAGNYLGSSLVLTIGSKVVKICLFISFITLTISLVFKYFIMQ
ncbi:MAG: hypothetical protein H6Q74_1770 [Firmicutes bacterium]|nr:hypothetical protein [Bacillota bacterium]